MIKCTVGTNTSRTTTIVKESATPKEVLAENNIRFETATVHLDGSPLNTKSMNQTFEELGVKESCYLIAVIKSENN